MFLLGVQHEFLHLSSIGLFGTKIAYHLLKKLWFQGVFLPTPEFSWGNNVVDSSASNTNGFLSKDTCVSSTQLKACLQ
jgi:hypothetical protein